MSVDLPGKVFGIGWAKTGTTTLGECLSQLGLNHLRGPRFDLVDRLIAGDEQGVVATAAEYESFDDWPWTILFQQLDAAWPDSRFILTVRDSDSWLTSYRSQLERNPSPAMMDRRRFLYGLNFPEVSDEELVSRYESHNRAVRNYFAKRTDCLLIVDWSAGDGWKELCDFLGRRVPDDPFPHANRANEGRSSTSPFRFRKLLRKR
jgi:hypothetical protein